ncbi:hypothetical protein TWF132_005913 [Orbilia oligospora]|nr:hypothetical protein TWF132_005913 [Orbilia oligospora]
MVTCPGTHAASGDVGVSPQLVASYLQDPSGFGSHRQTISTSVQSFLRRGSQYFPRRHNTSFTQSSRSADPKRDFANLKLIVEHSNYGPQTESTTTVQPHVFKTCGLILIGYRYIRFSNLYLHARYFLFDLTAFSNTTIIHLHDIVMRIRTEI